VCYQAGVVPPVYTAHIAVRHDELDRFGRVHPAVYLRYLAHAAVEASTAAGYDAAWRADIGDWDLIRLARRENRLLLTSDTGIFRIGIIRDGDLPALFIPHGLKKLAQLTFVFEKLGLSPRQPRCMACGGSLVEVAKESVRELAPPRSFAWLDQFYECDRCGQLFWEGTHWRRIAAALTRLPA